MSKPLLRIQYLIFKRLGKTDLDVLQDAPENEGHTYIAFIRDMKAQFDELFVLKNLQRYSPQLGREPSSVVRPGEHEIAALTGPRK